MGISRLELLHFHVLQRPVRSGTQQELVHSFHHFAGQQLVIHLELKQQSNTLKNYIT